MKTIKEFELTGKKVILRSDFNVSIKDGKIISNERITAELPTINYLIEKGAKVIIMSHLGKIKGEEDKKKNTLYIVYEELLKLINTKIIFSPATHGKILEEKRRIICRNPGIIGWYIYLAANRKKECSGKKNFRD